MSFKNLTDKLLDICQDTFGENVTYSLNDADDTETTIKGIFDNAWVDVDGVTSVKPTLRINLADLSVRPAKAHTLLIDEVNYRVTESREDGYGGTTLILQKV